MNTGSDRSSVLTRYLLENWGILQKKGKGEGGIPTSGAGGELSCFFFLFSFLQSETMGNRSYKSLLVIKRGRKDMLEVEFDKTDTRI